MLKKKKHFFQLCGCPAYPLQTVSSARAVGGDAPKVQQRV